MKKPVERDANGRFRKGSSGNRFGRPIRTNRERTPFDIRNAFLAMANSPVKITEGGKRKTVSISQAIELQLAQLALKGDRAAILQFKRREEHYASQALSEAMDLLEQLMRQQKFAREFPEDVTDNLLDLINQSRMRLKGFGIG